MKAGSQEVRAEAAVLRPAMHWRSALWREVRASLPDVGIWVAVGTLACGGLYILFEGWERFLSVAGNPLWWFPRIGGSLVVYAVAEMDQHKPRWRAIPAVLTPIAVAGVSFFSLSDKYPDQWPVPTCVALLALGLDWFLIRRWRSRFVAEQKDRGAESAPSEAAISA